MLLSAIILSNTKSDSIYNTTLNCINTLINSEKAIQLEIILIESNKELKNTDFIFPSNVKIIIPKEDFNFHKFLNIGIRESKGDYIGLFNNDLVFKENWFSEILKISNRKKNISSFSPVDFNSKFTPKSFFGSKEYIEGYDVRKHIAGWCIVTKKKVFDIFELDENFDFYFADDDYSLTLKKYGIKHAVVRDSNVEHLENIITKEFKKNDDNFFDVDIDDSVIPKELLKTKSWILQDKKLLDGYIKFHNKWGSPRSLKLKNLISKWFTFLNIPFLNYYLYSKRNL